MVMFRRNASVALLNVAEFVGNRVCQVNINSSLLISDMIYDLIYSKIFSFASKTSPAQSGDLSD